MAASTEQVGRSVNCCGSNALSSEEQVYFFTSCTLEYSSENILNEK